MTDPAILERLEQLEAKEAQRVAEAKRAEEIEAARKVQLSPGEWQQRLREADLRGLLERRERARLVEEAKTAASARVQRDREHHEARLAKHRHDRQAKLEKLTRPIREDYEKALLRLQRARDRKLAESARGRGQIELEFASKVAQEEDALRRLSEQVEREVEAARVSPIEIKLTPGQVQPRPRDDSELATEYARKLGRVRDRGRLATGGQGG